MDRWQEFDEKMEKISGGAYKLIDGEEWIDEKHGPILYHDPPIYLENDVEFFAHVLSSRGEVPSTLGGPEPLRNECEDWEDLAQQVCEHECKFGHLVPYDEPKRLSIGYLCSQCGETWLMRIRNVLRQKRPLFFRALANPFGRQQVGVFLKEGVSSPLLSDEWKDYFAEKGPYPLEVKDETPEETEQ